MVSRVSKTSYYLGIAKATVKRGTCLRRNFGAIIVKDDRIVSTGYSGSPRGVTNCIDIGVCKRQELKVAPGERYELCRSVHAEMNAIIGASPEEMKGSTLYLTGLNADGTYYVNTEPCLLCKRMIVNAGISLVVVATGADVESTR